MTDFSRVIGVILNGGRSTRMGSDKASLTWAGKTLLQHGIETLAKLNLQGIVVSGGSSQDALVDQFPDSGPLGGIHAAFAKFNDEKIAGFLFVPIDMPSLQTKTLETLMGYGQVNQTACFFQNAYLPLYLPNQTAIRQQVNRALELGDLALRNVLKHTAAEQLQITDEQEFVNLNHPHQWQQFITQITPT